MDIKKLKALVFEANNLRDKISVHKSTSDYIYSAVYKGWVREYNELLKKYNALEDLKINLMTINESDLSSTQKTARNESVEYILLVITSLVNKIETEINSYVKTETEKSIPYHQMRRCFKLGIDGCPVKPHLETNKIFIAMPFDSTYNDSFEFGLVPAIESLGKRYYRADIEITSRDIMCKICGELQSSALVIVNISGLNPNVMLEQGLAYGLGKPVIIIKDKHTKTISDLGSIEYIEYDHAHDLQQKILRVI